MADRWLLHAVQQGFAQHFGLRYDWTITVRTALSTRGIRQVARVTASRT